MMTIARIVASLAVTLLPANAQDVVTAATPDQSIQWYKTQVKLNLNLLMYRLKNTPPKNT